MYPTHELAGFALSEFHRGLAGLTEEEIQTRTAKANGTQMNAISWIVGHIASHWVGVAAYATHGEFPAALIEPFNGPNATIPRRGAPDAGRRQGCYRLDLDSR
mgnify:CR=1 FL=1